MKKLVSFFQDLFQSQRFLSGFLALVMLCSVPVSAWAGSFELGMKLYADGDYSNAARYLRQATQEKGSDPNLHYYLADSYLKLNRLTEAQAEYQKILAMAPDTQAARLSRVGLSRLRAYLDNRATDRWRQAGGTGDSGLADRYMGPPPQGEDYLDEVTQAGRYVRWSLAQMPLKIYVEQSPLGIRNFQPAFISQIPKALDVWVKALNHQLSYTLVTLPEQADIRVTWTNTIDTKGHSSDGGTAYTAGITVPHIRNEQMQSMEVQIATFDITGKPQDSDTILIVAIHEVGHALGLLGHSPKSGDIMYAQNQSAILPSMRDLNTIRRLYSLSPDINNMPADSRERKPGRQAEIARKLDESITKQEEQVTHDRSSLSWLNLGVSYFQKAKQLQKDAKPVIPGQPETNPEHWYNKALTATNIAVRLQPKDPRAYHKRSLVHQELGDYVSAAEDIRQAVSLDRDEPQYYMLQAWYLAKLGRVAEARAALDSYLLYRPGEAGSSDVQRIRSEISHK